MEEYFETFCKMVEWFSLVSEAIWNMDETRFRIGCGKAKWVITNDASKALVIKDLDNREYITSAKLINGVGCIIPAFSILQSKHILHK